jgi:predicted MFS family arabinose efflux permease
MVQLCAARVVAGIGGGGMNAVVSILLSDLVPLRERGVYQGYLNIIYAAGTSTGAPLGGILADSVGWRWSFIGQAPLCAVAFVAVYYILDLPAKSHSHWLTKMRQVDFLGAFTLILAVVSLLAGLDCGSNLGWSHTITIVSLSLAPPLFALFIFVEVKLASHPFAPGHIIFNSGLFACYLINFFGIAGQMAMLFFFPLFLQVVHGFTATQSGLFLVPSMAASVAASLGGGIVMKRTGQFYWLNVCSFGILLLSLGPFCAALWYKSWAGEQVGLFLVGIGAGCGITTALVGLLANAATEDSAVVIACSYLFRSLGSSMGISISAALLNQTLRSQLASRLTGDETLEIADKVRQSIDYVKLLPPKVAEQVRASYQVAMIGAMAPTLVFLFIAFTVTFWVRKKSLKN